MKFKLTPDEVTDAVVEYLAARGITVDKKLVTFTNDAGGGLPRVCAEAGHITLPPKASEGPYR